VFKVAHTFTHFRMTLHLFIGVVEGDPHPEVSEYAGFTWATPADMDGYAFDRANRHAVIFLQRADKRLF
jgi:adenine-specific DNA glycosylase